MSPQSAEALMASIQDRLVKSGEYDKMTAYLRNQLRDTGWFDDVNDLAMDELSGQQDPNFERISKKIESKALGMVPEEIKLDMLRKIKTYLDGMVEKAP